MQKTQVYENTTLLQLFGEMVVKGDTSKEAMEVLENQLPSWLIISEGFWCCMVETPFNTVFAMASDTELNNPLGKTFVKPVSEWTISSDISIKSPQDWYNCIEKAIPYLKNSDMIDRFILRITDSEDLMFVCNLVGITTYKKPIEVLRIDLREKIYSAIHVLHRPIEALSKVKVFDYAKM
jgi:hypothetical protein